MNICCLPEARLIDQEIFKLGQVMQQSGTLLAPDVAIETIEASFSTEAPKGMYLFTQELPMAAAHQSPKWQCNKFRDLQPTIRESPSMVQKLLEEEREAVKSALQAVDEHLQFKKKEVEEVSRKLMKDEPLKESFRAAFSMEFSKTTRNNRVSSGYLPVHNIPVKIQQKPIFLEAIYEEDQESGVLSNSHRSEKRPERIRHSALPSRNQTAKSRCSLKVTSARPRMSETLPPIDMGLFPMDGCYTGPLNYRWQRVADNYIDSDVRVRSRRRCRAQETKLRIGYQEEEDEDEWNLGIPRKRQITFGPKHSTSYSRWLSHFNDFS